MGFGISFLHFGIYQTKVSYDKIMPKQQKLQKYIRYNTLTLRTIPRGLQHYKKQKNM